MTIWEYKTVRIHTTGFYGGDFDTPDAEKLLNDMGAEGWELVSSLETNTSHGHTEDLVFVFKRPK